MHAAPLPTQATPHVPQWFTSLETSMQALPPSSVMQTRFGAEHARVAWVLAVPTPPGEARDMTKGAGPIPATAGGPPTAAGPELSEPTSKTLPADPPADLKSGRGASGGGPAASPPAVAPPA